MDLSDAIEPVTVLKTKSAELIRKARDTGKPIVITQNGRATAVLQDVDSFQRQRDALHMLKLVAKGTQELREGRGVSHGKAKRRLKQKLADLQGG
jgi:prevent-host-death family protein